MREYYEAKRDAHQYGGKIKTALDSINKKFNIGKKIQEVEKLKV